RKKFTVYTKGAPERVIAICTHALINGKVVLMNETLRKKLISKNSEYKLNATVYGEPLDLQKHHFRVEIKAPTFHEMEIKEEKQVVMRFLLDL
ncbi:MAG: archease, partial [Thermoproteota archaeon]